MNEDGIEAMNGEDRKHSDKQCMSVSQTLT